MLPRSIDYLWKNVKPAGIGSLIVFLFVGFFSIEAETEGLELFFLRGWFLSNLFSAMILVFCEINPFEDLKRFLPLYIIHQVVGMLSILACWLFLSR